MTYQGNGREKKGNYFKDMFLLHESPSWCEFFRSHFLVAELSVRDSGSTLSQDRGNATCIVTASGGDRRKESVLGTT